MLRSFHLVIFLLIKINADQYKCLLCFARLSFYFYFYVIKILFHTL